ncbi:hypothetical protein [Pseudodesulfovibrio piezophilus]|uniref:Uncharacterized protein n=1 Tax=Pseudodesulfovibrio piezophilus (strain DSM 21447 / JCM 15486 / C1TLV30) TaxID=1322246 RepID=M1WVV9_PSEP2|nr:hypothetical protein [Pseudodesulfovibrio piezophilus]CCH48768.1 conserved protein of unknown function [Pseudodesulfovibrio piezophilus C1TLV30]
MIKRIRLALEYGCSPIWIIDEDGDLDTVAIENMNISDSLKKDITIWNDVYHVTFNENYPPDSGFSSNEANVLLQEAFKLEGKELFLRLKEELNGRYIVESKFGIK